MNILEVIVLYKEVPSRDSSKIVFFSTLIYLSYYLFFFSLYFILSLHSLLFLISKKTEWIFFYFNILFSYVYPLLLLYKLHIYFCIKLRSFSFTFFIISSFNISSFYIIFTFFLGFNLRIFCFHFPFTLPIYKKKSEPSKSAHDINKNCLFEE